MKSAFIGAFGATALLAVSALAGDINKAEYTDGGAVKAPGDWREWVFVGAPLTPNALNGGSAPFPEFHHVYVEPSAFKAYSETGEWPEGTQIAKELVLLQTGDNCDESNGSCSAASGQGYFGGKFQGLELLVKDSERYADQPGNWAFYSFGHHDQPYAKTAEILPVESCSACHEANAADDFVFTQFYPVLQAAKPGE